MTEKIQDQLRLAEHALLTTDRLILRPLTLADAEDMYEYGSDEETTKFVFLPHTSVANTKENIAAYFLSAPLGKFAIELKETQKMIGTIDLRVNSDHRQGEIGYTLNRNYWGQGFMTEATKKILALSFEILGLERVCAMYDRENLASGRVMEKSGMEYEGVALSGQKFRERMIDLVTYSLTRQAYLDSQEKK